MLQISRLFLSLLCIIFVSFSVQNVFGQSTVKRDTSFQSSMTYGFHAGVPFLMTDAQYSGYNSIPTCCPTIFGSTSVLSLFPALGLSIEYNFIDILSFQIRPNVLQFGSKLIAKETVLVNNNGTPVPVIVDHSMDNNLLGIGADFSLIFKPTSNLRIGAGVSVHSLMTSTFVQEERIRDEANFGFLGPNLPNVRNRQEGTIPNVNKLPLSIMGSIGYGIPLSQEFQLVPEATFNFALSSFANELIVQNKNFQTTQDGSFKVNSLRLGIALLYNPTITEEIKIDEIPKPNQDSLLLAQENERKRIEEERITKEKIEKENLAKTDQLEKDRIAKEEKERIDKEALAKAEKERLEKERLANENLSKAERDRLAKEERERFAKEKADKEALAKAERDEKERLAREERERVAKEKADKEALAKAERDEKERLEKERLANENLSKAERDRLAREERERIAKEKAEKDALAKAEREEKDRLAREERERLAKEKAEKDALAKAEREEKDRLAREERERLAKEKADKEALAKAEREEKDRLAREERERLAKEKADKEALAKAEREEKDRLAREERERLAKEKAEKEALAKAESEKNALQKERELKEEQERKIALEKKKEAERALAEEERLKLEKAALELEKKKDLEAKEKEKVRAEKEAKQEDINTSPECVVNSSKPILLVEGIAKKYSTEKPTAAKSAIVFENIITNNTICLVATEKGKFKVPVVDASTHYGFYAKKNGYFSTSQNIPIEVVSSQEQKLPPPPVTLFKVTDMEENVLTEPIVLNNVFFKFNKPELSVKAHSELDRLADLLLSNEKVRVEIHGFVSKVEYDREFNKDKRKLLSSGRAKAVLDYLKAKGVKRSSMRVADDATISIEPNPLSMDSKETAEQAMCINVLFFGK
ncbi:MAG: OmpA family protein [Candidatus Kapabacteria bacterium]|nr:OmpA family protein [Candidatus Kapabacteria bacterium]